MEKTTGYRKNDLVSLTIEDYSSEGEGVGKCGGFTVFVKDTVMGDEIQAVLIKVKKNYAYGRLVKILRPSPDRCSPPCPIARPCGGCQLQALTYEKQLEYKARKVRRNLERIGGLAIPVYEPIIGMSDPFRYRNKAIFPIGYDKNGRIVAGFYAGRTHSIIACEDCLTGIEENRLILQKVIRHMQDYQIRPYDEKSKSGLVRHVLIRKGFYTGELMVGLVINGTRLPGEEALGKALSGIPGMTSVVLNVNQDHTNVILGSPVRLLWGKLTIHDRIGDLVYEISLPSFFQVNPVQTAKLYQKVLEYAQLTGHETVWDLYCGAGTISLFLAGRAGHVIGVEIVPEAVENAWKNAALNQISNVTFHTGKAEEIAPRLVQESQATVDVVVVDPPRKGCEETLLDTIARLSPKRIVYVSCDSATLARDLKRLGEHGYTAEKAAIVDMFPFSVHVESCVLLTR